MRLSSARGYTLLEVLIVSSLLAGILLLTLDFMSRATDKVMQVTEEAFLQSQVQHMVETISSVIQESSSSLVTLYRWTDPPGGKIELTDGSLIDSTQVAICFATPRNIAGDFVFTTGSGSNLTITSEPVWQGICVFAYYEEALYLYADYNAHTYDHLNPIYITGIYANTITLSDGTIFNRGGPAQANQTIKKVMANLAQLEIPNYTSGIYADTHPMEISLTAQTKLHGATFSRQYQMITATMITDVLTRNKN